MLEELRSRPTLLLAVQEYKPESLSVVSLIVKVELSLLNVTVSLKPVSLP